MSDGIYTKCSEDETTKRERGREMNATLKGIEVKATEDGRVYWMSDWAKAYELVKAGLLKTKFYRHLHGHTDFYLV